MLRRTRAQTATFPMQFLGDHALVLLHAMEIEHGTCSIERWSSSTRFSWSVGNNVLVGDATVLTPDILQQIGGYGRAARVNPHLYPFLKPKTTDSPPNRFLDCAKER